MVLPLFKPASMYRRLPRDRYDTIQQHLVAQIGQELANTPFDRSSTERFLAAYFRDLAIDSLDHHVALFTSSENVGISMDLLDSAFKLLQRLVDNSDGNLNMALLLDAIIVSGRRDNPLPPSILIDAFSTAKAEDVLHSIDEALKSSFGPRVQPIQTLRSLARATYTLSLILQTDVPVLLEQFTSPNHISWVDCLIQIYDTILPSILTSLPGPLEVAEWATSWFQIKLSLLDTIDAALSFLSVDPDKLNRLCELSSHISEKSRPKEHSTVLYDASLIQDYESLFKYSHDLTRINEETDDPRVQMLLVTLAACRENTHVDPAIVRRILPSGDLDRTPLAKQSDLPPLDYKGKGKAIVQPEDDTVIDLAISHILDILPDQDPSFLRRCLQHPEFSGEDGTERLISSLLEGSVPIDLSIEEPTPQVASSRQVDDLELAKERRNIFDDQAIDLTSLRLGKKRNDADDLMQDKTWLQEMKAEIMRRAEASSDEEEDVRYRREARRTIPLDDDFEDFDDSVGDVSVAGDGEVSSSDDEEAKEATSAETVLELAYIENPKLFDRDAATRRSKARADLKAKTNWTDEQIEGWRIMLERNPRKNKILQKHEFKGNKPLAVPSRSGGTDGRASPADRGKGRGSSSSRGRGRGRGGGQGQSGPGDQGGHGGGQGNQGGRGGQGEGQSRDRDRAWKEKNKSRARTQGHDKKMARGGGPPGQ